MGGRWRLLWLGLILGLLVGCDAPTVASMATLHTQMQATSKPETVLSFPYDLPESPLIVEALQSYSGAYWEDGSGDRVENVAGLMVFNPTDRMVEFASLAVEQEGKTLYFFVKFLPPNSRCLVLEYGKKSGNPEMVVSCRELSARWSRQELSREQVDYLGLGPSMTVINRDGRQIRHVTVRYKQYVKDGAYYLGGAVQTAHLFSLNPDERRTILPKNYDAAHAQIVGIEIQI